MDAKKQIYLAGPVGNGSRAGIRIFSATGKKVSGFDFEAPESGDGRFFVRNLRITSKGTVFVNIGNKAVRRYSSNGTELDRWERKTDGNIHLAPDNATDSLYVFDGRNAYLYKGTATVKLAEPKLSAIYMAEMSGDAEGRVHGYDFHSGIFFFDPKTGKPEFKPENANNMDLVSRKLLVDVADNLWVISGPVLRKLSPEGKELVNIKINGRKLRAPISIDYDAWGNFIVADRNNKRIMRYNRKGEKISDIDVSPFADSIDKIRMDKHNNLYLLRGDKWGGRKEILFRFNGLFAKED